jgi:hypothetical protein
MRLDAKTALFYNKMHPFFMFKAPFILSFSSKSYKKKHKDKTKIKK